MAGDAWETPDSSMRSTKPSAKIFGIGLPRTGTTSLIEAFKQHGITARHCPIELWADSAHPMLSEARAFADTPIPALYPKLDAQFPGSRFILTTRDRESWLESIQWLCRYRKRLWMRNQLLDDYDLAFFGAKSFDKDRYIMVWERFHSEVQRYFEDRPESLLTLNLAEELDTSRLLQFIGSSSLAAPWPRSNRTRTPSWLQELAFYAESCRLTPLGHAFRRIDAKIRKERSAAH